MQVFANVQNRSILPLCAGEFLKRRLLPPAHCPTTMLLKKTVGVQVLTGARCCLYHEVRALLGAAPSLKRAGLFGSAETASSGSAAISREAIRPHGRPLPRPLHQGGEDLVVTTLASSGFIVVWLFVSYRQIRRHRQQLLLSAGHPRTNWASRVPERL